VSGMYASGSPNSIVSCKSIGTLVERVDLQPVLGYPLKRVFDYLMFF
jgi:hypothetical protein